MAFPSTLDFKLKNNAILSRSLNQVHVPESGSTALPSQAVYVDLASGRYGSYLDGSQSYLQFRINNLDSVNPMTVDGSALSFFERVVVMSSGTIISDFVSHYGPWCQAILDIQCPGPGKNYTSIVMGTGSSANANFFRGGATIAPSGSLYVCVPLLGTIFDPACNGDRLIPVGSLSALQLQLYLADAGTPVTTASPAAKWSLDQLQLVASYTEIQPEAQAIIDREFGSEIKMPLELWRNANYTLQANSSGDSPIIALKAMSLKTALFFYRLSQNLSNAAALTMSSRINPFYSATNACSFALTAGSQLYPQVPIQNYAQFGWELIKGFHAQYTPAGFQTQLDASTYYAGDSTNPATCGSFVGALNLEVYPSKSGVLNSGVNCSGSSVLSIQSKYATQLPASTVLDFYGHYDALAVFRDGRVEVVW